MKKFSLMAIVFTLCLLITSSVFASPTTTPTYFALKFTNISLLTTDGHEYSIYSSGSPSWTNVSLGQIPITASTVPAGTYDRIKVSIDQYAMIDLNDTINGWYTNGAAINGGSFEVTSNAGEHQPTNLTLHAGSLNQTTTIPTVTITENSSVTITLRMNISNILLNEGQSFQPGHGADPNYQVSSLNVYPTFN